MRNNPDTASDVYCASNLTITSVTDFITESSLFSLNIYPNPSAGRVEFGIPTSFHGPFVIDIFAVDGRRVAGSKNIDGGVWTWDLRNGMDRRVSAGMYMARLVGPQRTAKRSFIVLR